MGNWVKDMTLKEALAVNRSGGKVGDAAIYHLICGFQPLHLATFFRAHLYQLVAGDHPVEIQCGVYGNTCGNIESAARSGAIGSAIALEWTDLDPRLGLRSSGGWSSATKPDILANCVRSFAQLTTAIEKLAARMPVALCPPNLPLPPIGHTIGVQSSSFELELELQLAEFLLRLSTLPGVCVVQRSHIESTGPCLDARMELVAGFPYTLPFASALAGALAKLLCPPMPKKGLITDLDDTLWSGLVGEVGAEGVSWSQESHTQAHGLYQQMLGHLAECGVLLGVCSKNEMAPVEASLARKDLFFNAQSLFPVCANWGPKSNSVAQVLKTWNIAADAVVFVDDNLMELEEVRQAHPGITCLQFSGKNPAAVWELLGELRDLFGKPALMAEDQLRQSSIRTSAQLRDSTEDVASPEFLSTLQGAVTLEWGADVADKRPLELVNKTNQFNLNGLRIGDADWRRQLEQENTVVVVGSYQDKFGPLGKIAVLVGSRDGAKVRVSHWVLSCRAFSRRIEHHMVDSLFRQFDAAEIEFSFATTERNQPLQEFFRSMSIAPDAAGTCRISRSGFLAHCGVLPHNVSSVRK